MSRLSRRAFLGRAAAAAIPAAVVACDKPGGGGHAASAGSARAAPGARPVPPVAGENSRPGDPHWWISKRGAPDAALGYAAQASVLPGEPVTLFASTTGREIRVKAFRMGWYGGDLARLVWQSGPVRGHRQSPPKLTSATNTIHTDWGPSLTIPTDDWSAGSYLLRLDADTGQRYVPVTVRSASTKGKVVIKNGVATWQAYNTWGGYDLYHGPGGSGDYAGRALAVSLDRPYDQEGAYLFMVYERKLINLVERMGLPLAYLTSMDIAADPHALDGASALVSPGHDEYWSPPERSNVTAARDAGVNLAFLGANAMFRRTRLAPTPLGENRLVICYKTSYTQDPMYGTDNALVTSDWPDSPHPDPQSSVTGTLYESFPTVADFVVATPEAWMFRDTGAGQGTRFAALVGIEYDRVNPMYPIQRPIQILSHSPLTCHGVNSYADTAYYTHRSRAGVFNAGTMRWVESFGPPTYGWGITKACGRFTRRVTANVLRAFADGPAADKYPAHDNLDAMHEWPGDPIAARHNLW